MLYSHILVTTDLSESSKHAFAFASHLAKLEGGRLTVLTVVSDAMVPISVYPELPAGIDMTEIRDSVARNARAQLEALVARSFRNQPVEAEVVVSHFPPANAVLEFAEENSCDLIVIASHGQGAMSALLMGSTVQRIIKLSHCPVLVVPALCPAQLESERRA